MPELPEVETIRRDLEKKILNKKIVQVKVRNSKSVGGENTKFVHALTGNVITRIERRGKLMIWWLKHQSVILSKAKNLVRSKLDPSVARPPQDDKAAVALLCHLKMTGQLIYEKEIKNKVDIVAGGHKLSEQDIECLPNQWTRVMLVFADGGELFFNDLRLFGYMKLANKDMVERALKKYGPEPLSKDFTFTYFSALFPKRKNTTLKALLLNQELVAGLGNIYVDEVCFAAGVKPTRRVGLVTKDEQQKLFHAIPKILTEALKHRGTTFRNFLDSSGKKGNYTDFLKVYDRDGEKCKRCGTVIKKTTAAQRGTHHCPSCQQ